MLKGVLREYSATTRSLQYSVRKTALVLAADGSGTSLLFVPVATLRVKASPRRQGDGRLPGLHQGWTSRKRAYSEIDSVSALLMLMLPRVMAALDVEAMRPLPLLIGQKVPIAP